MGIFVNSKTKGGVRTYVGTIVHGDGLCVECGTRLEKILNPDPAIEGVKHLRIIRQCPKCGGRTEGVFAKQPHHGRWWQYFFGEWDRKRAEYSTRHREEIPKDFREGKLNLTTLNFTLELMKDGVWDEL